MTIHPENPSSLKSDSGFFFFTSLSYASLVTFVNESNNYNFASVPFVCSTYSSAFDICCKVVKSFMLVSDATLNLQQF